ncbi:hypothetical protein [Mobilicoccus pelagius]|uniref:Uncharacterized protein n=1 Tax=Mobilicoccus pelagius NBRC 104925 TaxID=1089455 RepID=H5UQA4_9MICO|nr:hypothetical protein [Mobilicoccus pelagius]GAB47912.1 hypothetical protein MOPEL_031_00150 [Mobilicoccus pelagius NBRC 104925]
MTSPRVLAPTLVALSTVVVAVAGAVSAPALGTPPPSTATVVASPGSTATTTPPVHPFGTRVASSDGVTVSVGPPRTVAAPAEGVLVDVVEMDVANTSTTALPPWSLTPRVGSGAPGRARGATTETETLVVAPVTALTWVLPGTAVRWRLAYPHVEDAHVTLAGDGAVPAATFTAEPGAETRPAPRVEARSGAPRGS